MEKDHNKNMAMYDKKKQEIDKGYYTDSQPQDASQKIISKKNSVVEYRFSVDSESSIEQA